MRRSAKAGDAGRRPVVLYQPRDAGAFMPLGLVSLGSWLSSELVVIVDGRFELAPEARVSELAQHATCLAVTVRTGAPLRDAARISAAARTANPRLTVLWGGPHATLAPESCFASGTVDACIRGAGEEALAAAVEATRCGRSLDGIPGLVLPGTPAGAPQAPPSAERLPRAEYSLLELERHFEAVGARRLDYCSSRGARESGLTALPAERVLAELGELVDRHGITEIAFRDEDFFADPQRADAIASALPRLGPRLSWCAPARIDDVLAGGHDRLELLAGSRCRRLTIAIPDGVAGEGEQRERVLDSARLLRAAGVVACFELQVREPAPGTDALKAAVSLARTLCAIDHRFTTPIRRMAPAIADEGGAAGLEALAARWEAPWSDPKAARHLERVSFYFAEAQRAPRRRLSQQLLRTLALLRVRLGFFRLDLDRLLVEACTVLRTGRTRLLPRGD